MPRADRVLLTICLIHAVLVVSADHVFKILSPFPHCRPSAALANASEAKSALLLRRPFPARSNVFLVSSGLPALHFRFFGLNGQDTAPNAALVSRRGGFFEVASGLAGSPMSTKVCASTAAGLAAAR